MGNQSCVLNPFCQFQDFRTQPRGPKSSNVRWLVGQQNCKMLGSKGIYYCGTRYNWKDPLGPQALAVATILAPTQKLPRLHPHADWRAKRATPCQAEVVAILVRAQAVKMPPGAQRGPPNPKVGSPDAGRNLASKARIHAIRDADN